MGVIKCSKHGRSHIVFVSRALREKLLNGQDIKSVFLNEIPLYFDWNYTYYSEGSEFPEFDKVINEDLPKTFPYCEKCFQKIKDAQ